MGCAHVTLIMPRFTGAHAAYLNQVALRMIGYGIDDTATHTDLRAMMRAHLAQFDTFSKENKDMHQSWAHERTMTVQQQLTHYITLAIDQYDYSGGAHPNSYSSSRHYHIDKQQEEKITDWLKPNSYPLLVQKSETVFRHNMNLSATVKLDDAAGFFFEKGIFVLPDNYTLGRDSIHFFYNDYEIRCHADGPYTLSIPYSLFTDMIAPDSYIAEVSSGVGNR
jgi:Protein of unknown function (DUF3298)/Deacetylase PdaC